MNIHHFGAQAETRTSGAPVAAWADAVPLQEAVSRRGLLLNMEVQGLTETVDVLRSYVDSP